MGALQAMAVAADAREPMARGHPMGVTGYAREIGAAPGLGPEELETLETAALLHDVGRIGIPEKVLSKPGLLTEGD